jgi:hypothetical protein
MLPLTGVEDVGSLVLAVGMAAVEVGEGEVGEALAADGVEVLTADVACAVGFDAVELPGAGALLDGGLLVGAPVEDKLAETSGLGVELGSELQLMAQVNNAASCHVKGRAALQGDLFMYAFCQNGFIRPNSYVADSPTAFCTRCNLHRRSSPARRCLHKSSNASRRRWLCVPPRRRHFRCKRAARP